MRSLPFTVTCLQSFTFKVIEERTRFIYFLFSSHIYHNHNNTCPGYNIFARMKWIFVYLYVSLVGIFRMAKIQLCTGTKMESFLSAVCSVSQHYHRRHCRHCVHMACCIVTSQVISSAIRRRLLTREILSSPEKRFSTRFQTH